MRTKVFPSDLSDHDLIGCVRKLNHTRFKPKEIRCRDYSRYNPEIMNHELLNSDWSDVYNFKWRKYRMETVLQNHVYCFQPSCTTDVNECKRVKSKPSPWLNPELKTMMNTKDKLLRKYRKSKSDFDKRNYQNKRNQVNISLRRAKNTYNKDLLSENSNNPDNFWKTLKSIYPSSGKETPRSQSF